MGFISPLTYLCTMKVVAFLGSPRPNGNSEQMVRRVFGVLESNGIKTEMIRVGGKPLHGCLACMKCFETRNGQCANQTDDLNDYVEKMREADGIILASPTYFADVSAEMKALIDRTGMLTRSGGDFLRYKVGAAVISARRAGSTHAFDTINHLFLASQMIVPGSSYWNMGLGRLEGEVSEDEEGMDCMETLGMNMAWLLHRITG